MRNIILMTVCAIVAQTVISQQYFSKRYYSSTTSGSAFLQVLLDQNTKQTITSANLNCGGNPACVDYQFINKDGFVSNSYNKPNYLGFRYAMTLSNEAVYFSDNSYNQLDSFFYWHFGKLDLDGNLIFDRKFKILHLNDVKIANNGYKIPINYGLTFVKNDEVILYGEGMDKRMPDPSNVSNRALFIRLGLDWEQKGGNIWFELNDKRERRLGEVITDKDGEAIFPYVQFEKIDKITGLEINTSLIKMDENNQFNKFTSVVGNIDTDGSINLNFDNKGNYYTVTNFYQNHPEYNLTASLRQYLTKIDKEGKVAWAKLIPHLYYQWDKQVSTRSYQFNRISTCQNGDILCVGSCNLMDSFYIPGAANKVHLARVVPFMTRFDTNGNVAWHHFVVPQNPVNGELMFNTLIDIKEDTDGSILVAGQLDRDDPTSITGDAWLMRLSPLGCLNDACDHIEKYWHFPDTIVATQNTEITALTISPNPTSYYIDVSISDDMMLPLHYEIINIAGQRVEIGSQMSANDLHIETDRYSQGMYIIQLRDKVGKVWRGKVVVE